MSVQLKHILLLVRFYYQKCTTSTSRIIYNHRGEATAHNTSRFFIITTQPTNLYIIVGSECSRKQLPALIFYLIVQ